jgi:hypothetical protein
LSTFAEIAKRARSMGVGQLNDHEVVLDTETNMIGELIAQLADKMAHLDPPDPYVVDRVAMAIWQADRAAWETPKHWEWEEITPEARDRCRRMARAALAAMGKETP